MYDFLNILLLIINSRLIQRLIFTIEKLSKINYLSKIQGIFQKLKKFFQNSRIFLKTQGFFLKTQEIFSKTQFSGESIHSHSETHKCAKKEPDIAI